ncbi:MAG: serine/threonine protein kinase [Gammaproteobacteria bacterium]
MTAPAAQAFMRLDPDAILHAVENSGWRCDGRLQALASYENRVYQVGIEGREPLVVKFYRPGRWDDAQILEEHTFCEELRDAELPVIVPLRHADHGTLIHDGPYRLSLYEQTVGRPPSFDDPGHRELLGRFAARLHNRSVLDHFDARPELTPDLYGHDALQALFDSGHVPRELEEALDAAASHAMQGVEDLFDRCAPLSTLRLHGDLHAGNILWTRDGPVVMDFDDCATGPALADLWMFLSGDRDYQEQCLADLIEGYEQFRTFPFEQIPLVEALRTLRIVHHAAWIARRWHDPAFPKAFGFFATAQYWQELILTLKEQIGVMQEAPLRVNL